MAKINLTKKQKIKILERTKRYYTDSLVGLCYVLKYCIYNEGYGRFSYCELRKVISGFTITNAKRLSKKYNFDYPDGSASGYWWPIGNNVARMKFLDALIKEIENETC